MEALPDLLPTCVNCHLLQTYFLAQEMSSVIERLRELAATRDADDVTSQEGGKRKVQTTKVEPFNLSKPKPRSIPEPFPIKLENPYAKPIPKSALPSPPKSSIPGCP
jgi:hypothetical protein